MPTPSGVTVNSSRASRIGLANGPIVAGGQRVAGGIVKPAAMGKPALMSKPALLGPSRPAAPNVTPPANHIGRYGAAARALCAREVNIEPCMGNIYRRHINAAHRMNRHFTVI
ncbi:hypothetical protein [Candidatus Sodalis sp. SoCistrobi]|uniref:hypothetical protein n=1 Tax=Candidatus Sodalis sp. SoCistrobi TaxID=1922216 RepID=UPI000F79C361|nr:hypothetical protein [Candidatus Sodalis sp. SoCistrobi]